MKNEQEMVRQFHEKAGAVINDTPTALDNRTIELRMELIQEEWLELDEALCCENLTEIADALGDLLYVVLGTAVSCGIDIEPVFHEIHRSNMTKFIDGHRRSDGKWMKGPSYTPADVASVLAAQHAHKPAEHAHVGADVGTEGT